MKLLSRIFIILLVGTLISGMYFVIVKSAGTISQEFRPRTSFEDGEMPSPPNGEFHPERGEHGPRDGAVLPFGMIKAFGIMFVVAVFYYFFDKVILKKKTTNPQ